jgi:DNA-binding NarL/FixJ family response regulator
MLPEPVTGGLALLNLIKKIDATTTCFIFTTLADDGKEYIAKELGVDGYYLKPVAKDTVLYIVGSGLRLQDRKKRGKI